MEPSKVSIHSHSRKPSSRSSMPRRTTKGPLDVPIDPLSTHNQEHDPLSLEDTDKTTPSVMPPTVAEKPKVTPSKEERDLSFLLEPSIYHALSQVEVPAPFRKPFLPPPPINTPLERSLEQLDALLAGCDFLRAAHLAATILLSATVKSTDGKTIFRLLEVRYSCLELSANLLLAAQEAKALEDLSSGFYYDNLGEDKEADEDVADEKPRRMSEHIMPFSLRLQALRLQSIGFSDPRRGVSTLYDVALECREHLSSSSTTPDQRIVWTSRLQEVSVRVVNALIEMGDLDCAARTLESLKPGNNEDLSLWTSRIVLLSIKMGDISRAEKLVEQIEHASEDKSLLMALLAIAEGRPDEAAKALSNDSSGANSDAAALVRQNLAVAYLYNGEVRKARQVLETLLGDGYSFQTLTINLATLYDLTSDKSRELKTSMVSTIAGRQKSPATARAYQNADFKL